MRHPLVLALATALLLAGCAQDPARAVAGRPDVEQAVRAFYQRHGAEENWRCLAPYMEAVTDWSVLEEHPDELIVRVRYFYRDWVKDDDDSGLGFPRRICQGFGERVFAIDLVPEPMTVSAMSGPSRALDRGLGS